MKSWKLELNAYWDKLAEVDIRKEIFQGYSLSPLLFVLCMVALMWLLRRAKAGYKWGNMEFRLKHTVHIFNEDIGVQFGKKKCGVLIMEEK